MFLALRVSGASKKQRSGARRERSRSLMANRQPIVTHTAARMGSRGLGPALPLPLMFQAASAGAGWQSNDRWGRVPRERRQLSKSADCGPFRNFASPCCTSLTILEEGNPF